LPLGHSQSTVPQPFHELSDGYGFCPRRHKLVIPVLWHVVVIEIETTQGDTHPTGKIVQLSERAVAHQVRPEHLVREPPRLVDEDGHWPILDRKGLQMTKMAHRVVRQHGFLVALASGLVVLAVSLVQNVLNAVIGQLTLLGSSDVPAWQWWAGSATQFATIAVPLAVGVFFSFWFVAPIGPDLHVAHVITRSILATGAGAGLVFLTLLVTSAASLVTTGLLGQIRLGQIAGDHILNSIGFALATAGQQFLTVAPLVILVGVLLRLWLERHPSEHEVIGIVDTA
jgi:hypothetical protein